MVETPSIENKPIEGVVIEKKKSKFGRKPMELNIPKIEELASRGLTQQQIIDYFGYNRSSFYKYKATNKDLADAVKRGLAKGVNEVTNLLFENARKGNVTAQLFFLKCRSGWTEGNTINIIKPNEQPTIKSIKQQTLDPIEAARIYEKLME